MLGEVWGADAEVDLHMDKLWTAGEGLLDKCLGEGHALVVQRTNRKWNPIVASEIARVRTKKAHKGI
eukprot:2816827-Amphidinium_carterae.1